MISFYNLDQEYISFMSAGKCPIPHPPQKKSCFRQAFKTKKNEMTTEEERVIQRFHAYKWDEDENWKMYKNNLTSFNSELSENLIEKKKKQFYNQRIEKLPESFLNAVTTKNNNYSSQNNYSPSSTSQKQSPSSFSARNSAHSLPVWKALYSTREGQIALLSLYVLLTGIIGFISTLITDGYKGGLLSIFYRQCLIGAICLFGSYYFLDHIFSMRSIRQLLSDPNGQYIVLCFMFLTSQPNLILMTLLILLALCTLSTIMVNEFIPRFIRPRNAHLGNKLNVIFTHITSNEAYAKLTKIISSMELLLLFAHTYQVFTPERHLLRTFFLVQFIIMRYKVSSPLQSTCHEFRLFLDKIFNNPSCPLIVTRWYNQLLNALSNYVQRM
jgi:hypothetical protein